MDDFYPFWFIIARSGLLIAGLFFLWLSCPYIKRKRRHKLEVFLSSLDHWPTCASDFVGGCEVCAYREARAAMKASKQLRKRFPKAKLVPCKPKTSKTPSRSSGPSSPSSFS